MPASDVTYPHEDERVLVLVADSRDGRAIPAVLERAGVASVICRTPEEACAEIEKGAGTLLIDEESISLPTSHCLMSILEKQPSWSELPVIVLLRHGPETGVARQTLLLPADVTLVERPVRVHALVTVVRSALRSRLRQYLVRDQMRERERLVADLERSNRELQQFAHVASHDLQEPLRMVSSYLQLLEKKYRDRLDETADTYIHFAVDGAKRMQALVEGLLNYSRIARPQFTWVDLNRVYADAMANLAAAIAANDAQVHSERFPTVWGDATQMLQLFQNLISNGIKYKKPGVSPQVTVSAIQSQSGWEFSVRDNGIGMRKEDHEKIFQMFQRLHTREEYPGTGIGLASCKKIVEQHQGRIWVESSPGEGTTIFFTIPSAGHE